MIPAPRVTPPPDIKRLSVKAWLKGLRSNLDDGRTSSDALRSTTNVLLYQDGTVGPRPSLTPYGEQPVGTVLGEVYEFVKTTSSVAENWLITIQNVSGTAKVYVNKDGGAWQVCNGKTYSLTARAHFCQIDDKVLVMNGEDNLSYLDINTLTVIPFNALPAASGVSTTPGAGLVGTTYPVRYRVTASNNGETAASAAVTATVSKPRDAWLGTASGATEYVDFVFNRVTGASRYNVYMGDTAGNEVFIDTVADPGSGTTVTYRDLGSNPRDLERPAPLGDTTAGPKVTRASVINSQVFLTGDKDNPRYVRYGGTGESVFDFSPYGGGGWTEIGRGTKEFPVRVMSFRNNQGVPVIKVLCRGTNGSGKRYDMTPQTQTVGDTVISFFKVEEDNGQDGTDSPDGVISYRDALWYPSRDAFKSTYTKAQLQNILSTDSVSEGIEDQVATLNIKSMDKCVGIANNGRLYWALPVGASDNNQIWTLDLNRERAWMLPFSIAADWMLLYGDNDGQTHHLVLSNNKLYQFTETQATMDDTQPFSTNITSGQVRFSEDGKEWAKVIDITFVFLRPKGEILTNVYGRNEDQQTALVGTNKAQFRTMVSVSGWGEKAWRETLPWGTVAQAPTTYASAREEEIIEIDEDLNWFSWSVTTTREGVRYQLSDVIVRYIPLGVIDTT